VIPIDDEADDEENSEHEQHDALDVNGDGSDFGMFLYCAVSAEQSLFGCSLQFTPEQSLVQFTQTRV
jgi:hypothetical protein